MNNLTTALATVVGLGSPVAAQAATVFEGNPLEQAVVFGSPDEVFPYPGNPQQFTVAEGTTYGDINGLQFSFADNVITLTYPQTNSFSGEFNGVRFSDFADALPDITGVTLNSTTANLTQSDVFFDANSFGFNQTGVDYAAGDTFSLTVSFADATPPAGVPEPATWAMMIGGLGAVGGTMRRRKAKTPAVA